MQQSKHHAAKSLVGVANQQQQVENMYFDPATGVQQQNNTL